MSFPVSLCLNLVFTLQMSSMTGVQLETILLQANVSGNVGCCGLGGRGDRGSRIEVFIDEFHIAIVDAM